MCKSRKCISNPNNKYQYVEKHGRRSITCNNELNRNKNNIYSFGSIVLNTGIIMSCERFYQATLFIIEMAILKIAKQLWVMPSSYQYYQTELNCWIQTKQDINCRPGNKIQQRHGWSNQEDQIRTISNR